MDKREREYIEQNLSTLLELIVVTTNLLAVFKERKILSQSDLESIQSKATPSEQTKHLLDLLVTRTGAFAVLIKALQSVNQTGAALLLSQHISTPQFSSRIFNGLSRELNTFIYNSEHTMGCVLLSKSIAYSLIRIREHHKEKANKNINLTNCSNLKCHDAKKGVLENNGEWVHLIVGGKCLIIVASNGAVGFDGFTVITDTISWSCLSPLWKNKILHRNIRFQGRIQKLSSFVSTLCKLKSKDRCELLDNLETEFLLLLLSNTEPEIASGNLPQVPEKYIPRRIVSRHRLSNEVIGITKNSEFDDIFVFRGDDLHLYHLGSLVDTYGDGRRDCSTSQLKRPELTVNCILLDCEEDFEELVQKSGNRSIHLLECIRANHEEGAKDFKLYWMRTIGSIHLIQNFVHKIQDHFSEEFLYGSSSSCKSNVPNRVCIADSPGMGKSCLLAKCGNELMKHTSEDDKSRCYVQYFTMSNYVATHRAVNTDMGTQSQDQSNTRESSLLKAFLQSCSNFYIGREFVRCLFTAHQDVLKECHLLETRIHLMFDGFDELEDELVEESKYVLEYFSQTKVFPVSVTLWVTTRPQYVHAIEDIMNVLAYTIQQFSTNDQETLLTNYWGGDEEMRVLAKKCIERFHKRLLLTDDQKDIIGFPLLCNLLAKIYEKETKKKQDGEKLLRTINDITIDKVFTNYILKRFQISSNDTSDQCHLAFLKHLELALQTIFPEIKDLDGLFTNNLHFNAQDLLNYGLLEHGGATDPLRFVHRTIAEYLVAHSMLHILSSIQQSESRLNIYMSLVRTVLSVRPSNSKLSEVGSHQYVIPHLQFKYPNVCFFLNFALVNRFKYDNENERSVTYTLDKTPIDFRKIIEIFQSFTPGNKLAKKAWDRLIAATRANYYHIGYPLIKALTTFFPQNFVMRNFIRTLPEHELPSLVYLASRFSSFELAEKIYDLVNLCHADKPITKYWMAEMSFHEIEKYNEDGFKGEERIHSSTDCYFGETLALPNLDIVQSLILDVLRTIFNSEPNPDILHYIDGMGFSSENNFEGTPLNPQNLLPISIANLNISHLEMNSVGTSPRYPSSPTFVTYASSVDSDSSIVESLETSSANPKPLFLNISVVVPSQVSSVDEKDQRVDIIVNINLFSLYFSVSKPYNGICESKCSILDNLSRVLTPLHCAVEAGNDKLTKHLLERDSENFCSLDYSFRYLLQFCLLNSINDSSVVLIKKENILRLFKSKFPYLINENPACIGICLEKIHLRLLVSYIKIKHELNPDWHVLSTNNYGENMLHLLAAGHYDNDMTPEKYHDALVELHKVGLNIGRHLIEYNHLNWRAIDIAVSSMDLLDKTFDWFHQLGINFDFVDFRGSSILYKAVSGQRGGKTLKKLIKLGATFTPKCFGETILHTSAVFLNFEAVQFFVTEGLNLNMQRKECLSHPPSNLDPDNFYFKHLSYHLEEFKDQLDDFHSNIINDDTDLRYHFEHIMYNVDNLPYNFERIRSKLAQFYVRKEGVYNSEEDYLQLKLLYNNLRDILDEFSVCQDSCYKGLKQTDKVEKPPPDLPGDIYITVNLQDDEGNTPLHVCLKHELHFHEYKASQNEANLSQANPQAHSNPTSIPVKRRFLGTISTASSDQSSRISRYQHLDLEFNNQHKIVSFLIQHGASIAIPNNNLITPMDLVIQLCLDGLTKDERPELEKAQKNLFSEQKYMTLALKGLLLNINLGRTCHPSLIKSFANAIRDNCGDIDQKNHSDGASLLHLAAKRHSYFGVEYLTESNAISVNLLDKYNRNPLEYMICTPCKHEMLTCLKIRDHLKLKINKQRDNTNA